jgi:hypothetical protein
MELQCSLPRFYRIIASRWRALPLEHRDTGRNSAAYNPHCPTRAAQGLSEKSGADCACPIGQRKEVANFIFEQTCFCSSPTMAGCSAVILSRVMGQRRRQ